MVIVNGDSFLRIRPHVFTKGGDRVDFTNIPEWQVCQELGIDLVAQVGKPKLWSSSDFLKEWGEFLSATYKETEPISILAKRPVDALSKQ